MLKDTFVMDKEGLDTVTSSKEINSFIKSLKIPRSKKTGEEIPVMDTLIPMDDYCAVF